MRVLLCRFYLSAAQNQRIEKKRMLSNLRVLHSPAPNPNSFKGPFPADSPKTNPRVVSVSYSSTCTFLLVSEKHPLTRCAIRLHDSPLWMHSRWPWAVVSWGRSEWWTQAVTCTSEGNYNVRRSVLPCRGKRELCNVARSISSDLHCTLDKGNESLWMAVSHSHVVCRWRTEWELGVRLVVRHSKV